LNWRAIRLNEIEKLQDMVDKNSRIVFFGGAGVSTESGIPDFRSVDGLYHQKYDHPPETILSHTFFLKYPELFFRFYREKMIYQAARPNPAHIALARLEAAGKLFGIVTQNIDGLHQAAGSKNVIELHGTVYKNHCVRCCKMYDLDYVLHVSGIPVCTCGGTIKPDVVLYEEPLNQQTMENTVRILAQADMLIIGGTSLSVYPAAGFVQAFTGKQLVILNKTPTPLDEQADLVIAAPIGETLSKIHA
jgi:NAD-dependent deacetylase